MCHVLKTLLLWFLISALPAQGFAAVRLACGPLHHDPAPVTAMMSAQDHHPMELAGHAHDQEDQVSETQRMTADKAKYDSSPTVNKHATVKCCFGAAMSPYAFNWHQPHDSVMLHNAAPTTAFSGHIPAALERPPRLTYA